VRPAPEARRREPSAPDVRVGPMGDHHLDEVVAIEQLVFPRPRSAASFRDDLNRDDRCYLVAREDGEVVGYAGLAIGADAADVLTVAVAPARQGSGHGLRLVGALLVAARSRGVDAVTLEVRASAEGAQRLYRRAGFVAAGVRPGYYQDGEDALIMWWHAPGRDAGVAAPTDRGR
jgi:[ribosomal protein S18]-alanine N-acetyltransferase